MGHSDSQIVPPPLPTPLGSMPPQALPPQVAVQPSVPAAPVPGPVPAIPQSAVPLARPVVKSSSSSYLPPTASSPSAPVTVNQAYHGELADPSPGRYLRFQDDQGESDRFDLYTTLRNAPAWLVSSIVHMLLLIILGLWGIAGAVDADLEITLNPVTELGDQLIDPSATVDLEPIEVQEMELSPSEMPVLDPFAAPSKLELAPDGMFASSDIGTPIIGNALAGRQEGSKQALLDRYGGSAITEGAVEAGLDWLKRRQRPDGSWSLKGPYPDGSYTENEAAATAMALLAFQGAGNTHLSGPYRKEVEKGISALLKMQKADGLFQPPSSYSHNHMLYTHAQATIALCELYGMTKDSKLRQPAELAVAYCVKSQDPKLGGWKYVPAQQADLSVTGWFVMALQSAKMADLNVPKSTLQQVTYFLDSVQKDEGATYAYQPERDKSLAMTAEGLLCRQYLGWSHDHRALLRGATVLNANPISYDGGNQDVYYWYYAAQVLHHLGGKPWEEWNKVMKVAIPAKQVKKGQERGSWDPGGDAWGSQAGRLYVTCLSIYMLEVYYRHLPIYKTSAMKSEVEIPE